MAAERHFNYCCTGGHRQLCVYFWTYMRIHMHGSMVYTEDFKWRIPYDVCRTLQLSRCLGRPPSCSCKQSWKLTASCRCRVALRLINVNRLALFVDASLRASWWLDHALLTHVAAVIRALYACQPARLVTITRTVTDRRIWWPLSEAIHTELAALRCIINILTVNCILGRPT